MDEKKKDVIVLKEKKYEFNWYSFLRDENVTEEERAKQLADFISSFFNICGDGERALNLTKEMMNQHRTLQQAFMRFVVHYLKQYAEIEYDDRNEAAVKIAKVLAKAMDENPETCYLPLI